MQYMNMKRSFLLRSIVAGVAVTLAIPASADTQVQTIVEHITADSVNIVVQPLGLEERLQPQPEVEEQETDRPSDGHGLRAGYRIQVFSDNNPRTAKNEANSKARTIRSRFPKLRTSVTYKSPYWRVRVGDFKTQQEANTAADELRRAFPSFGKEIRVVKDRVNITE